MLQFFLGLLGLSVFLYVFLTKIISKFLFVHYSINAQIPLLTSNNLFITPSFLDYLGIALFVLGLTFTIIILTVMKGTVFNRLRISNIIFFSLVYLTFYPVIALNATYKYFKGNYKWR